MGRHLFVIGCVLDDAGNVVGTIRSKSGQRLNALRSIFEVTLYREQAAPGAKVPMPIGTSLSETLTAYTRPPSCSSSEDSASRGGGNVGRVSDGAVPACQEKRPPATSPGPGASLAGSPRAPDARGPATWADLALAIDKYTCLERDLETVLRALNVADPAKLVAAHGPYRVAVVLRAAGAKSGKLRNAAAWVLSALSHGWDVDEY